MSMRKVWRGAGVSLAVVIAVALAVRWLGQVDYDTHPSAEVPSLPTAPVFNEADEALAEGARWAKANRVDSHQTCQATLGPGLKGLGCHRYVTAQKYIPLLANWRTQPTTRDCVIGVHAHYDPLFQDMIEQGEYRAVSVWQRKRLEPDLRECNNIDNVRIIEAVHEPLARIEAILTHLRAGQPLSENELAQLRRDYPVVEEFREHNLRSRYLALADELFALTGGRGRVFPLAQSGRAREDQCAVLAQQVYRHKAAFHEAMAESKQVSGRTESAQEQAALVTRQNELLAIWTQAANDRLKVGCPPSH